MQHTNVHAPRVARTLVFAAFALLRTPFYKLITSLNFCAPTTPKCGAHSLTGIKLHPTSTSSPLAKRRAGSELAPAWNHAR